MARFPAEVEADLHHYYRLDLVDMYRGHLSVRKISVLVMKLPRGAQTWEAIGGAGAITAETDALWMVEHALYKIHHAANGGKGKAPERRPYPPGALEQQAKAARTQQQAEAFRAKHTKP